ncbi:MAG: FAD:protein FMN transferase [Bacilli bacterium]|nr:FAD:protein FMN transferase [Bacilli bacterium]MDD4388452.1 FAD:protein FMN transferase [Bacilli bacterium]
MVKLTKKLLIIVLMVLFFLAGCKNDNDYNERYYKYTIKLSNAFNTTNSVTLFTLGERQEDLLNQLAADMDLILLNLDCKFNVQDRSDGIITDLMQVNDNAGVEPVIVDKEVVDVLEVALDISQNSIVDNTALYDPTILPVSLLWDITNRQYNIFDDNRIKDEDLPSANEIEQARQLVNYRNVVINKEHSTVFLKNKGMKIDLGSIVKGYAADKIKSYLLKKDYNKAVIDIGRNILTVGQFVNAKLEDVPWRVGIQRPFASIFDSDFDITKTIGILSVNDLTLVTSGIYEKYILTESGKRYHHILNPQNGYPMENNVVSVTVICEESIIGDVLSTTLFLLGIDKAMALVNELDYKVDTIWILETDEPTKHYEIYISPGLEGHFVFNTKVESKKYTYKGVYNAKPSN